MKLNLLTTLLLALFLFALPFAQARDVTFAWDENPPGEKVTSYYLEASPDGVAWQRIGAVEASTSPEGEPVPPATELRIETFPDTTTHVRAFAVNAVGLVSPPSEVLIVSPTPAAPGGLRVTMTPAP